MRWQFSSPEGLGRWQLCCPRRLVYDVTMVRRLRRIGLSANVKYDPVLRRRFQSARTRGQMTWSDATRTRFCCAARRQRYSTNVTIVGHPADVIADMDDFRFADIPFRLTV
jgi:hypothetical protein